MSTWLITGCSTGLGRALAEAVIAAGHNAVVTARDAGKVAESRLGIRLLTIVDADRRDPKGGTFAHYATADANTSQSEAGECFSRAAFVSLAGGWRSPHSCASLTASPGSPIRPPLGSSRRTVLRSTLGGMGCRPRCTVGSSSGTPI